MIELVGHEVIFFLIEIQKKAARGPIVVCYCVVVVPIVWSAVNAITINGYVRSRREESVATNVLGGKKKKKNNNK